MTAAGLPLAAEPPAALDSAGSALIAELLRLTQRIAHAGDFQAVEALLQLTGPQIDPQLAQLAEAFARMVVQIEAREFQLQSAIEDLQRVKAELEVANFDPLTGLANRVIARDRLAQALAQAARQKGGAGGVVAVMYLDLDRFKAVNDQLGHAAGDELLRQVAQRLRAAVREADTLARLGGDEFLCILPALNDLRPAQALADRLVQALCAPFALQAGPAQIGTSIGLAAWPAHAASVDALVACADQALYAAKHAGRNTWRVCATPTPAPTPTVG